MQKSFLSFLDEIGLAALRKLSAKSDVHLCREQATGRLLVAKLWPDALANCAAREMRALAALGEFDLAPRLAMAIKTPFGPCVLRPFLAGQTLYEIHQAGEPVLQKLKHL